MCRFIFLFNMHNRGKIGKIEHFPFLTGKMPKAALFPLRHRGEIQILHVYWKVNRNMVSWFLCRGTVGNHYLSTFKGLYNETT